MTKNNITLKTIYDEINKLRYEIKEDFVTKVEFAPVKNIVYGTVKIVLTCEEILEFMIFIGNLKIMAIEPFLTSSHWSLNI